MNLRDALLRGLENLPGTRSFHAHVLVSSPRKHSNLYPFASPRPRTYLQDILVLLSEQPPDSPRVFVSAIEAKLYHVPSTSSAVLYVSKVDSTGQATSPSPTQALVRAFLTYYVDPGTRPLPATHLWVHLFARAQSQYLFPNSAEFPGKRPLTDVKLCAWWKRQFSLVAQDVAGRGGEGACIRLFYLLPGLGELEACHALERVYASAFASVPWTYGHPYGQTQVPLPSCSIGRSEKLPHIGHVVPWFDDDPKARFLDEIAYTTDAEGVKSPERKRPRTSRTGQRVEEGGEGKEGSSTTDKMLRKVSIEEFWERMSFRQECIAGAVTGFFVMATSCPTPKPASCRDPLAGQVSAQMMKRVLTSLVTGHEFPSRERAVWSTQVLEEAIKGLCDGPKIVPMGEIADDSQRRRTPEPNGGDDNLAAPETPSPRAVAKRRLMGDASPEEPVASVETYDGYVYGSVAVSNPEEPRKGGGDGESAITVLTARRKKRGRTG